MKMKVPDEDGFIAVVNPDRYKGFVDNNWQLKQLFDHFVNQMNEQNLIVWQTNNDGGGQWDVEILDTESEHRAFRQFEKTIEVTTGELCLTNYTDLTMAAQFEDERVPAKHNAHLKFEVDNGLCSITVRQMFDPDKYDDDSIPIHFELVVKKIPDKSMTAAAGVYWSMV
jgi:hypothetical protein